MQFHVFDSAEEACLETANRLVQVIHGTDQPVLGLPTGRTPEGVYRELVTQQAQGQVDFSRVQGFALDEYAGLTPEHPQSFAYWLQQAIGIPGRWPSGNLHSLDGSHPDPLLACQSYEALIEQKGGLDCVLLGIGANGHIAFNEPNSPLDSRARPVELSNETRHQNAPAFGGDAREVPTRALTLGLANLMEARQVVLLATGSHKSEILARALYGPVTTSLPASVLQTHPNLCVLADKTAAQRTGHSQVAKKA